MSTEKTKIELEAAALKHLLKEQREQKRIEDRKTAELILFRTEARTEQPFNKRIREHIELRGGKQISLAELEELNRVLLDEAKTYEKTFPPIYYEELRRLTGFKKSAENPHYKPAVFAIYTLRFIYARFPQKELIAELQLRNPYMTGYFIRQHKHFQFLNDQAQNQLEQYIKEAVEIMATCDKMHEFRIKYCKKYKLPITRDMFYEAE